MAERGLFVVEGEEVESEGENGDGDKQAGVSAVMMIGVRW